MRASCARTPTYASHLLVVIFFLRGVINMKHDSFFDLVKIAEYINTRFMDIELKCLRDRGHVVQVDPDLI